MPVVIISEYQSGRVVFALENGTEDQIYLLESYIQDYKKISKVENQFIVRHTDGTDTDTAGHPISRDTSALLFQMNVQKNPGEIILSMDVSDNTPGTRLGINQIKAYAVALNILERHLFSYVRIKPKIELTGVKLEEAHLAYDREKLEYKNKLARQSSSRAKWLVSLGILAIIVPVALVVLSVWVSEFSWFLIPSAIVAVITVPIGLLSLLPEGISKGSVKEPSEEIMLQKYNQHFGGLCIKVMPLGACATESTPKMETNGLPQKTQEGLSETTPAMKEGEEPRKSMGCDV
jgi:hypothetical protein